MMKPIAEESSTSENGVLDFRLIVNTIPGLVLYPHSRLEFGSC